MTYLLSVYLLRIVIFCFGFSSFPLLVHSIFICCIFFVFSSVFIFVSYFHLSFLVYFAIRASFFSFVVIRAPYFHLFHFLRIFICCYSCIVFPFVVSCLLCHSCISFCFVIIRAPYSHLSFVLRISFVVIVSCSSCYSCFVFSFVVIISYPLRYSPVFLFRIVRLCVLVLFILRFDLFTLFSPACHRLVYLS